jgi:RND family efflux transporter MFP subunit
MKKEQNLWKKILWVGVVIILVILVARCNRTQPVEANKTVDTVRKSLQKMVTKEIVTPVKVIVLKPVTFVSKVKTVSTTKAKRDYVLSSKIGGEITFLNAEIGNHVEAGEILGKIDPEIAQASLHQAQANFDLANNSYTRQKQLAEKGLISQQQLDTAEAQFRIAEATLEMANINLRNSKIISPIKGIVAEKFVSLHEYTSAGKDFVRIIDPSRIEVEIGVSDKDVVRIQPNNVAYLSFSSYPNQRFEGVVANVGTQAKQDVKTFPVKLSFNNKDGLIKGGMIADVTVLLNVYPNAIVIPFYLLQQTDNGGYYVFVEKNGQAIRCDITIAEIQDDQVRVISGLSSADKLITDGYKYVTDKSPVQVN